MDRRHEPDGGRERSGEVGEPTDSERLAPVAYLPWAVPGMEPEASTADRSADAGRSRRESRSPRGGEWSHLVAVTPESSDSAAQSAAGSSRAPAGSKRRRRDEAPAEFDEPGPERDERIDRIVVGRLRRSALSISEVRAVLVEHGLDDVEVEEWLDRYERLGYLDDARLAEQLVHSHGERRGRGSGAILAELGRRGIPPNVAREAVGELDPETELSNAITVAERRARQLGGLDRAVAERRLSAFLARRGYPGDVVREAVATALPRDRS
ncbi:regulatory protein RecX [Agromyces mediolanus]|uniref:regulatory protein RecX n=1 Tax=Agromyces mediolanus TaxID=41986 RepID=UPI0038350707